MSGDTPEIVLNEFGDLSRKARRELEARGIDPDTAVVEYIAATGQMPVISAEEAAAAKAQAQVEAAVAREETISAPPVQAQTPEKEIEQPVSAPVEQVAVAIEPVVPPISVPVTAAETGPIEPLVVSPALDSGSLHAVEETLATVSEHTGEIVTGFDSLVSTTTEDIVSGPSKGELRRLARKEKKAQSLAAKAEKAAAKEEAAAQAASAAALIEAQQEQARAEDESRRADQEAADRAERERLDAEQAESEKREAEAAEERRLVQEQREEQRREEQRREEQRREEQRAAEAAAAASLATSAATATSQTSDQPSQLDVEDVAEDEELVDEVQPQTISEATAAIAIAEAVAAAEAVVEAGEVSVDNGNLTSAVPATTGSISVIPNTLILPNLPETTGNIAPIVPTGEIVITGSILIPSSVSQTGALEAIDTSEIDTIAEEDQPAPTQGMAPVSAASAVSAYNISNTVVTTPRGMNERLPFILSVTAAGLAVAVVALFVAGYFLGMF
ncbi:MAG: hypothetical protein RLY59_191 [Actinomycetota bacterium]